MPASKAPANTKAALAKLREAFLTGDPAALAAAGRRLLDRASLTRAESFAVERAEEIVAARGQWAVAIANGDDVVVAGAYRRLADLGDNLDDAHFDRGHEARLATIPSRRVSTLPPDSAPLSFEASLRVKPQTTDRVLDELSAAIAARDEESVLSLADEARRRGLDRDDIPWPEIYEIEARNALLQELATALAQDRLADAARLWARAIALCGEAISPQLRRAGGVAFREWGRRLRLTEHGRLAPR